MAEAKDTFLNLCEGLREKNESDLQNPVTKRLKSFQRKELMADIELIGDDGIAVPAVRYLLGCASPVLEKMLYGKFAEANSSTVLMKGYTNTVLRALVDFCSTDKLNPQIWVGQGDQFNGPDQIVKEMLCFAELGHQYQIDDIAGMVTTFLSAWITNDPTIAYAIFNFSSTDPTKEIRSTAIRTILQDMKANSSSLRSHNGRIECLSPKKLRELFQKENLDFTNSLAFFRGLLHWHEFNKDTVDGASNLCKILAKKLNFTLIDPIYIKNVVRPSGLVDDKQLVDSLLNQAISVSKFGLVFKKPSLSEDKPSHVLLQGAGVSMLNGVYKKERTGGPRDMLQFRKKTPEGETCFMVKNSMGQWRVTDTKLVYYTWSGEDEYPPTGARWKVVREDVSLPGPICHFFYVNEN